MSESGTLRAMTRAEMAAAEGYLRARGNAAYRQDRGLQHLAEQVRGTCRLFIFGGALRSYWRGCSPRDVDLVFEGSKDAMAAALSDFKIEANTCGGWKVRRHPGAQAWDVWPLAETHAFESNGWVSSFVSLPKTGFLNVDAAAAELLPEGLGEILLDPGFVRGMVTRELAIECRDQPSALVNAVRALRLIWCDGYRLGSMRSFLEEQFKLHRWGAWRREWSRRYASTMGMPTEADVAWMVEHGDCLDLMRGHA